MTPRPLQVLLVEDDEHAARALAVELERRGHSVRAVRSAEEALLMPTPDVLVSELDLPGRSGLDLLAELHQRGHHPRTVFVTGQPSVDACRRAFHLGACDLLERPSGFEPARELLQSNEPSASSGLEALIGAVEGLEEPRAPLPRREGLRFSCRRPAQLEYVEPAVNELLVCLVGWGLRLSVRARIAGACAEVLDNAQRHAYPGGKGAFLLEAELRGRHVFACVADEGSGFDPVGAAIGPMRDTARSGLARAASLCEDIKLESAPGRGTRVTLRFYAFPAVFEEERTVDLSDLDYLAPGTARRVLESLRDARSETAFELSPALAVCVGRMLAGAPPDRSLHTALWS